MLHTDYFEPSVNSTAIEDFHFARLSKTLSFNFLNFLSLGKIKKNPGLSSRCGNSVINNQRSCVESTCQDE